MMITSYNKFLTLNINIINPLTTFHYFYLISQSFNHLLIFCSSHYINKQIISCLNNVSSCMITFFYFLSSLSNTLKPHPTHLDLNTIKHIISHKQIIPYHYDKLLKIPRNPKEYW